MRDRYKQAHLGRIRSFIHASYPDYAQSVINRADMAMQGKQVLLGTRGQWLLVGNPPEWHDNKVNNNGYVWMLNRMNHWLYLTDAYLLTEERKYLDQVLLEMLDWIESCPAPALTTDLEQAHRVYTSVDPWRQLEVGERMGNVWPVVLNIMSTVPGMLDNAWPVIIKSIEEHGRILREVCPLLWPEADHNYYLTEMWGLFSIACSFPELEQSAEWGAFAIKELERCMLSQFSRDGGQLEGCPSYHNFTSIHMGKVALLASCSGAALSEAFHNRFCKLMEYGLQACRPTGQVVPIGDSSADDLAAVTISLGALYLGETRGVQLLQSLMGADRYTRALLPYLFQYPELLELVLSSQDQASVELERSWLPRTFWDRELNHVSMRSDWTNQALSVFFACKTPVYNGHSHIDPAGFDLTAWGKPLLVDPGCYSYWWLEERRKFKSAAWHNVLTVNEQDPFEYISTWSYGPQQLGIIESAEDKGEWMRSSAVHYNYDPVVHRRDLIVVPNQFVLVLDEVSGLSEADTIQLNWHFNAIEGEWDSSRQLAYSSNEEGNAAIWSVGALLEGRWEDGSISDRTDELRPSRRMIMTDCESRDSLRRYASLIVAFPGKIEEGILQLLQIEEGADGGAVCTIILQENRYSFAYRKET
ncbi:alginate lyase family protein [Paenibacillus sp. GCM10023252]|uniref:alginate lyase family protein n=1 Tax=Paenibacillus sp. GCM10023252 TaxID=3252649 RepID=UPI0036131606